jgi:hypothetical protein
MSVSTAVERRLPTGHQLDTNHTTSKDKFEIDCTNLYQLHIARPQQVVPFLHLGIVHLSVVIEA